MAWQTYLVMYFGTSGKKPSEVAVSIEEIGFKTTMGPVDFIYEWKTKPTEKQILELGDKVSEALAGSGAVFNLDTHD